MALTFTIIMPFSCVLFEVKLKDIGFVSFAKLIFFCTIIFELYFVIKSVLFPFTVTVVGMVLKKYNVTYD